jgi:SAM-dependent methyltransferase
VRALLVLAVFGCSSSTDGGPQKESGTSPRKESGTSPQHASGTGPQKESGTGAAFDKIYREATWGTNADKRGHSGTGSTLRTTLLYRTFLQDFLATYDIHSVVDAGCGDWEFSQTIDWSGIDYKGYDIVESVVANNKKLYEKPNIHFFVANIVETELPPADLLIVKHVLQHLPDADVTKFIAQLPKYKHALITNGVNATLLTAFHKSDIEPGGYRELDITRPPFGVQGAKVLTYADGIHMHQVVHVQNAR